MASMGAADSACLPGSLGSHVLAVARPGISGSPAAEAVERTESGVG